MGCLFLSYYKIYLSWLYLDIFPRRGGQIIIALKTSFCVRNVRYLIHSQEEFEFRGGVGGEKCPHLPRTSMEPTKILIVRPNEKVCILNLKFLTLHKEDNLPQIGTLIASPPLPGSRKGPQYLLSTVLDTWLQEMLEPEKHDLVFQDFNKQLSPTTKEKHNINYKFKLK